MKAKEPKQMWLRLEDEGWQIVIPETDSKPHATLILIDSQTKEQHADLADYDCPCKPRIEWTNKIIIHNSFEEENES